MSSIATTETKRVLHVHFNGTELLEGRLFDTTSEENAKKNNIHEPKRKYGPLTIITGEHELLPLVEKELVTMRVGETKHVSLNPKDAFGERKPELVRIVPRQVFIDQKINPMQGLVISVGNAIGRVQSVSGGRVRVDFNHPLAGRNVSYEVTVEKEISDPQGRAEILYEKYYSFVPGAKKDIKANVLTITLGKDTLKNLEKINESIKRVGNELGVTVEFIEDTPGKKENTEKNESSEKKETSDKKTAAKTPDVAPQKAPAQKTVTPHGINRTADALTGQKKKTVATETTKDTATTIQRPKKKQ